ncbi:hypothetical protein AaE_000027 [Aphanomyces astaci]|uniref:Uncharacterized protein n=1 Tax=Aphanomyces astaci TaxID=112090 RepID=A0A6A5B2F2_APHAT|nr:hypothetical protein AaE_000027 [Aphanomyces astaci]
MAAGRCFHTSEVYVLCAVHFMLLHLIKHPTPDAAALLPYLSLEFVRLCLRLSLSSSIKCKAMLSHALASKSTLLPKNLSPLPSYVVPFITALVGSPKTSHIAQALHQLYLLACHMVASTVDADTALGAILLSDDYKNQDDSPTLRTLMKLLLFPRVHNSHTNRFDDGLAIMKASPTYHAYLLPYAVANSASLDEWKAFLHVVLDLCNSTCDNGKGLVQTALDHMAVTLSPQDLLAILPDDADVGLFLDALARAVRLHDSGDDDGTTD